MYLNNHHPRNETITKIYKFSHVTSHNRRGSRKKIRRFHNSLMITTTDNWWVISMEVLPSATREVMHLWWWTKPIIRMWVNRYSRIALLKKWKYSCNKLELLSNDLYKNYVHINFLFRYGKSLTVWYVLIFF